MFENVIFLFISLNFTFDYIKKKKKNEKALIKMPKDSELPVINYIFTIFNNTNFNDTDEVQLMYKNVIQSIYKSSFEESKFHSTAILITLILCSLIGSITNMFVIFIFILIFNKRFNRNIQSKLASSEKTETTNKNVELYQNFNKQKNQLIFNADLKLFYSLIKYLAVVDFFTCSVGIPVTVYELWNNITLNEFCCKTFEFIRAIGVVASNFIIILVAIERFLALYKPGKLNTLFFEIRIIFAIVISITVAVLLMLQVSVYQRVDDTIIYIGMCLKSDYSFNKSHGRLFNFLLTFIFTFGCIFVSIMYSLVWFKTYEIKKRRKTRKKFEYKLFIRALNNSIKIDDRKVNKVFKNQAKIFENKLKIREQNARKAKCLCFSTHCNFRIAVSILLVTFIYYLSIIPWCLTITGMIKYNAYIHYTFLLNNTINPFIYGFLNPNFRNCGLYLLNLIFSSMRYKVCSIFRC